MIISYASLPYTLIGMKDIFEYISVIPILYIYYHTFTEVIEGKCVYVSGETDMA